MKTTAIKMLVTNARMRSWAFDSAHQEVLLGEPGADGL